MNVVQSTSNYLNTHKDFFIEVKKKNYSVYYKIAELHYCAYFFLPTEVKVGFSWLF